VTALAGESIELLEGIHEDLAFLAAGGVRADQAGDEHSGTLRAASDGTSAASCDAPSAGLRWRCGTGGYGHRGWRNDPVDLGGW
jgi:hypothetical protein